MATEKTIGIRIQLNGLNTVVKDIETLEREIKLAKEDLKQVEIGGPIFQQLQKEISVAEGQLKKLNRETEGLTNERKIEGIGKLGAGISSSFAAATAAVSLFGDKNESVTKAATQAQNLLTLALSARGIMEIKTGAQITARIIAERASAAAITAENVAMKSLYTTLAANPYGAIAAGIGLLITAFIALDDEVEKQKEDYKSLSTFRAEAEKGIITETNKLKTLRDIVNDGNVSLSAKKGAYMELQKLVPTLTNLTYDQAQAQNVLNGYVEDEITLIGLRARQKAYEDYFVQEESKQIDKRRKEREDYIKSLNVEISQEKQRLFQAGLTYDEVEKTIAQFKARKLAEKGYTDETEDYKDVLTEVNELEDKKAAILRAQLKAQKEAAEAAEKQRKQRQDYISLLLKEIKLTSELLVQTTQLKELDNSIIQKGEDKITQAKNYAAELEKLKTFTELYNDAVQNTLPVQDKLGGVFEQAKKMGEGFIDSLDAVVYTSKNAKESLQDFQDGINILSQGLSKEDAQILQDFANNYKEIFDTVTLLQQFKGKPLGFSVKDFQQVVTDVNLALGKLIIDPYSRSAEEIAAAKSTARQRYELVKKSFVDEYTLYLEDNLRKKGLTELEITNRKESTKEIAAATYESLAGVGNELQKFEQGVTQTSQKVVELNKKIQELSGDALKGFIVSNAERISEEYGTTIPLVLRKETELVALRKKLREKNYEEEKKYSEALVNLEADLAAQGIDISKLTYEQRLVLLEKFLAKEVDATKQAEDKKKAAVDATIKSIEQGLQKFNQLVGQLASIVAQNFEFAQKKLDKFYKDQLEKVVGDSEEANQKRLELEKEYQAQKAQLTKQATIKALQFQLVQAIADTAQAVVANLEVPPLAFIVGALGAAQIAIIAQQISYAQSLASGGRIGAGGMLYGPSHEQGGIYAGGVNLEGGEMVMNRTTSMNYGGLLSTLNQQGGGKAIVSNSTGSLQEERLLQILAKDKQTPIRAYVLGQEITKTQQINRRLDELATI